MPAPSDEINLLDSFERIPTRIFPNAKEGSVKIAKEIAELIRKKASIGESCVLGLATGSSPLSLYAELVRMHKEEG
jgi:glucosamine-6-phosphate deaminase